MKHVLFATKTEQQWVYDYVKEKEQPLPVVLGTNGTWTGNGKKMVFLIAFTLLDLFTLADIYDVSQQPYREMNVDDLTYYAINISNQTKVKAIIQAWQ